ncbi:uncharacterized protein YIL046W-A [Saccharomyces cerevisiae S288C]|uniref:Uncharacterized protein YIL046W-A n=1 Tax=Saccharomyces cerevisiae (strain ATCC 204508 / S288c) TaxID=559292 RepID=YI046_YEAST|eukprot:NP_878097.1 hypothetical protein YIL046W-A [Saccharomyces cerevisiae S288C]
MMCVCIPKKKLMDWRVYYIYSYVVCLYMCGSDCACICVLACVVQCVCFNVEMRL